MHCNLPTTCKKQEVWIQTGWMQVWEKQLVPTGRRGQGSSDKDWKTLGMSFSLPQPSWCFLELVKGAHTPGIQGIAQKEEANSVSGMPSGRLRRLIKGSSRPQSIQGS